MILCDFTKYPMSWVYIGKVKKLRFSNFGCTDFYNWCIIQEKKKIWTISHIRFFLICSTELCEVPANIYKRFELIQTTPWILNHFPNGTFDRTFIRYFRVRERHQKEPFYSRQKDLPSWICVKWCDLFLPHWAP